MHQFEADWCLRMNRAGWKVVYVPEFEVMHIGGEHSTVTAVKSHRNFIWSHVNRYYFIRKHYGNLAMHVFRPIMSAGAMLRLLKYAVLWFVNPQRRSAAAARIAGNWKAVLLGVAAHPEDLPEELARENANAASFQLFEVRPACKYRRDGAINRFGSAGLRQSINIVWLKTLGQHLRGRGIRAFP